MRNGIHFKATLLVLSFTVFVTLPSILATPQAYAKPIYLYSDLHGWSINRLSPDSAMKEELRWTDDGDFFFFQLDEKTAGFTVSLKGPVTADFNIYVKYGSKPSPKDYDYASQMPGSNEIVDVKAKESQQKGTWWVLVHSLKGSGEYIIEWQPFPIFAVPKRYALVVANEHYIYVNDAPYTINGADEWDDYLEGIGYSVDYLTDVTEPELHYGLSTLRDNVRRCDIMVFVYIGHGDTRGLQTIEYGEQANTGLVRWSELENYFWWNSPEDSPRIFLFIESCHSGAIINAFDDAPNCERMYITTACASWEGAWWDEEHELPAWTYCFLVLCLATFNEPVSMEYCFDQAPFPSTDQTPQEYDGDPQHDFYL